MDAERFNEKHNRAREEYPDFRRREYAPRRARQEQMERQPERKKVSDELITRVQKSDPRAEPFRKNGVKNFKEFDFPAAIEDFKKALEFGPKDVATHFNLACAYSLMENAERAFHHLDRAVAGGFNDFKKLKEHDALAYLRIQGEFDAFEKNGFRLTQQQTTAQPSNDLLQTEPDLLDQLNKLNKLREQGLLNEEQFAEEKRKLLS
jgi:hypothetical protein